MATHPFDVVANVDLLVLGVRHVIAGADWQQQHVLAGGFLEGEGHRDGATFAAHVGFHLRIAIPHGFQSRCIRTGFFKSRGICTVLGFDIQFYIIYQLKYFIYRKN